MKSDSIEKLHLKLIVTIVDRDKASALMRLYKTMKVHWHYVISGQGTATSETMLMLGLGSSDKSIVLCIEPAYRIDDFLKLITKELQLEKKGKGIAFTLPISGVNHPIIQKIQKEVNMEMNKQMKDQLEKDIETMIEKSKSSSKYSIVIGIINQGYSEEVMDTAKANGVRGGTVVHARRIGIEDAVKFLGISLQEEKELLMILTTKENKHQVMKELSSKHGVKSETRGVYLSLPVEDIAGVDLG